jgi:FKBP-type peptidyl-prolyl cis-trans isomerase FkpA
MKRFKKPSIANLRNAALLVPVGLCLAGMGAFGAPAGQPVFESEDQKLLYYWGTTFGEQIEAGGIRDPKELQWVARGLQDRAAGTAQEFGEEYRSLLNNYLVQRNKQAAAAETLLAREYVGTKAKQKGTITTKSGLVYREVTRGKGVQPTKESRVKVQYTGTLRDGKVFDSSLTRGAPLEIRLTNAIACWSEAIPMMKVGGKAEITCPPELAYGERGNARIPGGSALTFDVELLAVEQ